jgi:DNA-binding MarR family transcriptional regulator
MAIADEKPLSLVHVLSSRIGRAFYSEIETRFGISIAEWRVVITIEAEPGICAAEITNRWALEKMSVNRAIQRLHNDGYVSRTRDPEDGRSYRLELTDKGKALYARIAPTANARYNELMSVLNEDESAALLAALSKLIDKAETLE